MMWIGIDPGKTGAIACVDGGDGLQIWDTPQRPDKTIDTKALGLIFRAFVEERHTFPVSPIAFCLIERAQAYPKDSRHNAFTTGVAYGLVVGAANAVGWPCVSVAPSEWKKHMKVTADKETSLNMARHLFPGSVDYFKRKKDHGRAEAALLAWLARHWGDRDYARLHPVQAVTRPA
jgi:crossover junction endodeoxyribonuclease RuvC